MIIVSNEKTIKRNKTIGQVLTFGSLAVLGLGMYLSFKNTPQTITLSFIALVLGFVFSQIGIFYGNKFGRRPRPDEVINTALKGLNDDYILYHYVAPVPHLLVGPSGVWNIIPYFQKGTITYLNGRWKQKGGNWYMKAFAQEGLGRPDIEITSNLQDLSKHFKRAIPDKTIDSQAMLFFYNDQAVIEADDAPVPALTPKKVKEFLRRKAKETPMSDEDIQVVVDALPQFE